MFRVQSRLTGDWLHSPHVFSDGDKAWPMGRDERDAHVFKSRKEAKDTILAIQPNGLDDFKIVGRKGF